MESTEAFSVRSQKIARRFLQTAVVVDDEAYIELGETDTPKGGVKEPDRWTLGSSRPDSSSVGRRDVHTLNAKSVMDSFASLGVICGVVGPGKSELEMIRQADIVVLDWKLKKEDSDYALNLLRDLLTGEVDRDSLRLIAIYTGEQEIEKIYKAVFTQLETIELDPKGNGSKTAISYRHGRVVLYAKSGVNLTRDLKERSISEEELPEWLVQDFAEMTEGLLPGIALTSLAAVREGAHMVLDKFCADLDPAFLAHRACLDNPDDAEQQIVNHVAEEFRGLMDNAVVAQSPAGAEAVESWIRWKGREGACFVFGDRELDSEQTIVLATNGLDASALKKNAFEELCAGFDRSEVGGLDEQLAWIMSFRTVFNEPLPTLWLGSVVTVIEDGEAKHLICMRPRCDCVRLDGETTFFFLPLVEPKKEKGKKLEEQLVVRLDNEFKRLGIGRDPSGWVLRRFNPLLHDSAVRATKEETDGAFVFTDTYDKQYIWRGELKAEYAQRIAQSFTTTLSRVAVDESEWLRKMAQKDR